MTSVGDMLRRCAIASLFVFTGALAMSGRGLPPQAQPAATAAVDLEALGPKVGATIPDFTLPDQQGEMRSLTSLLGPKGAVLVFFRSADW
jgi:cytochrome oxidase Cu insertion factor (SCO1/SenC/PrrC family)